eukprot:jgi/Orpsp1_1/1182712/evm.model.c7180000082344.1
MKFLNTFFLLSVLGLVSSKAVVEEKSSVIPSFSLPSGFYDDETLKLEINITDPEATIYYSLDGSVSTEESSVYETPFTLKNRSDEENVL